MIERFPVKLRNKIRKELRVPELGECWTWTGTLGRDGYGLVWWVKYRPAHCVAYELSVGPIPEGLELDHLCRNTGCINPAHLEAVTHKVNMQRAYATKTHCKHGHPFTVANTRIYKGSRRCCRACNRTNGREIQKRSVEIFRKSQGR